MDHSTSITEQYLFALDCKEPNNYTSVPNIVDHLTYDEIDESTGEKIKKRLSVFAIHLYRIIRHIGGQESTTWKSTDQLAELANMSTGQVSKCKKELCNAFHQLDGNPLIKIECKDKTTYSDNKRLNGTTYHKIKIENIWGFNRAYFLLKKHGKEGACSPHEPADEARSPHEPVPQEARSPGERNKNNDSNTPLFKEQTPAQAPVSVCSLNANPISVPSADQNAEALNWLLKVGFDILGATHIVNTYNLTDLEQASRYVQKQIKSREAKMKPILNIKGYLVKTLQGKWWKTQAT